ncbi:MAG: hypothetical protein AB8H86_21790 [Polyangiales bacterium]
MSTYLPFTPVVSREAGGGKAGRACAAARVCQVRTSVPGRLSSILFAAIVLMAAATYALAQTTRPDAPLDALDDARWIRAFADSSAAPLADSLADGDLETSLRVLAALPADDAPEAHLVALSHVARSDDPSLAPAAAQCAIRIVEGLTHHALMARESAIDGDATDGFRALAEDPSARADLQRAAEYIVARLGELERREAP